MNAITPVLSYLQDSSKTLPMLLIEAPTTAGRTIQGYKHGGIQEGRERICEETLGGVVWLFGIKTFNKIGDFIGEKILGLKDIGVDVGKDSLRNPFENVTDKRTLTAAFKFGKIIGSTALGIAAMGVAVPKLKKAMTNAIRKNHGLEPIPDKDGVLRYGLADKIVGLFIKNKEPKAQKQEMPVIKMDDFIQTAKNPPAFKGNAANALLFATHNLENNTAWRLLSSDGGMLAGRVANSRNEKEAIEYTVRDSASSIFYIFAAPFFSGFLRKVTGIPNVHPKGAEAAAEHFKDLANQNGGILAPDFLSSKLPSNKKATELIKDIKFAENKTIRLDEFNAQTANKFKEKADLMSLLQPELKDGTGVKRAILSEKQVIDIMSDAPTSDPEFLKKAISAATNGRSDDPKAFVSRKSLEKIRGSFDKFGLSLEQYAAKNNSVIDSDLIDNFTKSLNRKNFAIHLAGISFAVLGLAYLIPKFQYFVSDKLTGTKGYNLGSENNQKENQAD